MTATEAGYAPARAPAPFKPFYKWDRNFFAAIVAAIWAGVVLGFGTDTIRHINSGEAPYPLIVHVHAIAYVGWLVLLATQVLLIRNKRQDLHRKLGVLMIGLAVFMVIIGPVATFVADAAQFGKPGSNPPAFLAIPLCSVTAFAIMVGAAVLLRKDSSAHKRLIILGTLMISNAGFARLERPYVNAVLGQTHLSFYFGLTLISDILILVMAGYDLYTRRKLHPAFVAGVALTGLTQALVVNLFFSPWWGATAAKLLGH